ncbi:MAG: phage tail tape measure protein [Candidatus Thorarchaeota archaeon]
MSKTVRIIYQLVDKVTPSLGKIVVSVQGVGQAAVKSSDRIIAFGAAFQESEGILGSVGSALVGIGDKIAGLGPIAEAAAAMIVAYLAIKGTQAIIGFTEKSIEAFAEFEYAMADVAAKLGMTVDEISDLSDLAKEIGIKYGVGAKKGAEGLESFAAAGFNAEESAIALEEAMKLSIITGASLNESAKLIVQSLAAYGDEAKDAAKYVDALVSADLASIAAANELGTALGYAGGSAATFGLNIQETLTAIAALTNKIGSAEKAGRYLDAMFADLMRKSDRLGFSIYDASGKLRPLADIFGLFAYKMKDMTTEMKMAYLAEVGLTRQSARTILHLAGLGDSAEETRLLFYELEEEINETGTATAAAETKMATLQFQMNKLDAAAQNVKIEIGRGLHPVLMGFIEGLIETAENVSNLIKYFNDLGELIGKRFKPTMDAISESYEKQQADMEKHKFSIGSLIKKWLSLGDGVKEAAEDVDKATDDMEKSTESLGSMMTENVENMVDDINEALSSGIVGDAQDEIQKFVDCSVNKWLDLHDQIRDSIYDLTVESNERYAQMLKQAEYVGGEEGEAIRRAAEDYKKAMDQKIAALREFQRKIREGWLGSTLGDISGTWTSTNGDRYFAPTPTDYPTLNYPPTMRDITVNVGGINVDSISSDIDKEELLEEVGQTVVDAIIIGGRVLR